jgi:hypothetical protein
MVIYYYYLFIFIFFFLMDQVKLIIHLSIYLMNQAKTEAWIRMHG